jgi:excinuclease ABC subunit A
VGESHTGKFLRDILGDRVFENGGAPGRQRTSGGKAPARKAAARR